jgi:hypothetical protein
MQTQTWRNCSGCKQPIALKAKYYTCSVSSCNVRKTNYVFCSMPCFDQHLPIERHKSAGAVEQVAPSTTQDSTQHGPTRRIISSPSKSSNKQVARGGEVLVIASRFKDFINQQSEFNTSADVFEALSDHLRHVAMQAIDNARESGRKTVMAQDLKFLDKLNLNI